MLIALHNVSDKKIRINIAEHESQLSTLEAIAYLRFHELTSKSSTQPDVGDGGRLDIIAKHPNTQKMIDWIRDPGNKWRRNKDDLKQILKDSDEYKQVKQELKEKSLNHLIDSRLRDFAPSLVVTALILIYILLENKQNIEDLILVLIPLVYTIVFEMFRRKG
ncbi:MAG: hypothetical protein EA366_09285 [Spirulina sp. DLM2.Bin59]|nr:MAG: hypothetical protein EA366_09285 [Spirulina sp. DLM2.Bin59]